MVGASPSLFELCKLAVPPLICKDEAKRQELLTVPLDILECVLGVLTPFALELLHQESESRTWRNGGRIADPVNEIPSLKRSFADMVYGPLISCLNDAWKSKFCTRWPLGVKWPKYRGMLSKSEMELLGIANEHDDGGAVDWRQQFWESFLQECLNQAAAQASTPAFQGPIGDIKLPEVLLHEVGLCENFGSGHSVSQPLIYSLKYICGHFGSRARYLRLRGVLLTEELSSLIPAKLLYVAFNHVTTAGQMEAGCQLLTQTKESLQVLELQRCRFTEVAVSKLWKCMIMDGGDNLRLRHLFIVSSCSLFQSREALIQFHDFLYASSLLESIVLVDSQVSVPIGSNILANFDVLRHLYLLRLAENELGGFIRSEASTPILSLGSQYVEEKSGHIPLRALDLGSNRLCDRDMQEITPCLNQMSCLKHINLSDNPIGDDGLRAIIPSLQALPLVDLSFSACNLTLVGACLLFKILALRKPPISSLKLAHNLLGSTIAIPLAGFLRCGAVESLELADIGLGCNGALDLQEELTEIPHLKYLGLSQNRLGTAGSGLLSKLITKGSALNSIDGSSNILDTLCFKTIAAKLLQCQNVNTKSVLELLDLRHNPAPGAFEIFEEINRLKNPVVLVSSLAANSFTFHDDDP